MVLLTAGENYFSNVNIASALQYKDYETSSDSAKGVTLMGSESKGVKVSADGKDLIYARSNFNVSNISLREIKWGEGREASGADYDYPGIANEDIDVADLFPY